MVFLVFFSSFFHGIHHDFWHVFFTHETWHEIHGIHHDFFAMKIPSSSMTAGLGSFEAD
jgi:hypothetical protein